MRSSILPSLILIGSTVLQGATAQAPAETEPAVQAEVQWVHLIDAGDYAEAWSSAAHMMQAATPEPDFAKAVSSARMPLGALGARTLKQARAVTQLPGAPDGHYVVAQYTSRFANKAEATETIVASLASDGTWHVAGYFIR